MDGVSRFFDYWLNRCPACGLSAATLCARCWFRLNEVGSQGSTTHGLIVGDTKPFVQRGLYRWDESSRASADILREVILASKGRSSDAMMLLWSSEFQRRGTIDSSLSSLRNWIVIAPPSNKNTSGMDHATRMARALAQRSGENLRFEPALLEVQKSYRSHSQKAKSRKEREKIVFKLSRRGQRELLSAKGFLFVDDVIATGATAKAAWAALGKPKAFEAWAVALRSKSSDS